MDRSRRREIEGYGHLLPDYVRAREPFAPMARQSSLQTNCRFLHVAALRCERLPGRDDEKVGNPFRKGFSCNSEEPFGMRD